MAAGSLLIVVLIAVTVLIKQRSADDDAYTHYEDVSSDIVIIGAVLPIHTSLNGACGPINSLGIIYSEAIAYVIEKINNRSDFIPGVTLAFEIHDSCSSVNHALDETLDLLTVKTPKSGFGISAMIGEFSSAVTIPMANLLDLFRIPLVSFSATDPRLSDKTQFGYFLRTVPSDTYEAIALTDIINYFKWTYVAVVNSGDVYGRDIMAQFISNYKNDTAGRCIAGDPIEIPYPGATTNDYDAAVDKLMAPFVINATVVVVLAELETVNGLLDAIERRKQIDTAFTKEFIWVGTDVWTDRLNIERKNTARNIIGVVSEEIDNDDFNAYFTSLHISNHTDNPWFGEFWEAQFNCSLNGTLNPSLTPCYTANQSLATGYNEDILYLAHTFDAAYTIAYGIRDFQKHVCNGSIGLCSAALSKGRFNVVTLDGSRFFQYLLNVTFARDTEGFVSFDRNGDIVPAEYTVESLQVNVVSPVGEWVNDKFPALNISAPVVWNQLNGTIRSFCSDPCGSGQYPVPIAGQSSCCWTCSECTAGNNPYSDGKTCKYCALGSKTNSQKDGCAPIVVIYNYFTNPWAVISVVIAAFGIVTATIVGCIMLININHKVVMASSRELTVFLFVGIFLCYSMPFFFIATPSPAFCAIRRFGVGFSFSACFIPILVRVIRIHRIFNREVSMKPPRFTNALSQVIFASLLLFVQVVILTVWLALERPNIQYIYSFQSGEIKCSENPYIGLSVTLSYNAFILVLTMYFAFRARKVPQSFNETKFISLTACILIVIWIAFLPIYFGTVALGAIFQTGSQVLAIVLSATTVLGCFLIPKVYIMVSNKWKEYHVSTEVTPQMSLHKSVINNLHAQTDSGLPSSSSTSLHSSEPKQADGIT